MQLELNHPTVGAQNKLRLVCFWLALTVIVGSTLILAYNEFTEASLFSILDVNITPYAIITNVIMLLVITVLNKSQLNYNNQIIDRLSSLEHHQNLITNNRDLLYFNWSLDNKKIYLSNKIFNIEEIDRMNSMSFEDFLKKVSGSNTNFYQLANDTIRKKIDQIDTSFKYQTNISNNWYKLKARVIEDKAGRRHIYGIMIDNTRDKNHEVNANRLQSTLNEVIESLPISFVLFDNKDKLIMSNKKFRDFYTIPQSVTNTGMNKSEIKKLLTKSLVELPVNKNTDSIDPNNSNPMRVSEIQLKDKRWIMNTEITTSSGYSASMGLDISNQKKNEQTLLKNEHELIYKVEELENLRRKQEIQSQQLIELAKRVNSERDNLRELENDKSKFLLNMSHELRTPLNAIIGFSEMLKNQTITNPDKIIEYAHDIHNSGNELMQIISSIESMTSLEKENITINKRNQKIDYIIDEVLDDFKNDILQKNISIKNRFDFHSNINCNEIAIKQAISNIISNSIKFNKVGGTITIKNEIQNGWLNIIIEDNGHGMQNSKIESIFKPFNKSRKESIINQEGARLGLPIANSLINVHDGNISLKSAVGKGTAVTISIPLISSDELVQDRKTA
ncbi:MAG: PAS domain-containing sensor histidine kinase [Alphaproteobacteria bacterium]|nr:PAS domain-containing sensor histidine kinase [Alphaproteobacteria bacterium]